MIRTLLVQDYRVHQILSILGALALTVLLGAFSTEGVGFSNDAMLVRALPWSVFTVWSQITAHDGWKVLTDEELISKRILRRNSSHLSMSGDTPFARGPLANDIGVDGHEDKVEEMLQGTYVIDDTGMDDVHASSEMKCFMQALQVPKSKRTGDTVPLMNSEVTMEDYVEVFNKTAESTASSPSGIHYGHY